MPLRFFFDECADDDVARGLRRRGVDVITAAELRRKALTDTEQLEFAWRTGRVIYTTDRHFLALVAAWLQCYGTLPNTATCCPCARQAVRSTNGTWRAPGQVGVFQWGPCAGAAA